MEIQKPSHAGGIIREAFKQAVIEACCEPGASVAGIAICQRCQREPSPAVDA